GFRDERLQSQVDDSDMIQDAWLEVHRSFAGFRGRTVAEFVAWLRQVVLRSAGRTFRKLVDRPRAGAAADASEGGGPLADSGSSPSARASRVEQESRVTEALARLPEDMQQVLLGRFVDGLPHAVLAERLGRTEGAVRVLYV